MKQMALQDLTSIMREAAGEDDSAALDGDILDTPFSDLGYDSIAILETAGQIQVTYEVVLDDDSVFGAETPRELIALVNANLATPAST